MLRISKLADYGIVIMTYLARHEQALSSARAISEETRLTLPTVSKLLKRLTRAGFLISTRGANGGYRLIREAECISVVEMLYALGEARGLTECWEGHHSCALHPFCHVQSHWSVINQVIEETLNGVTLKALASPYLIKEQVRRGKTCEAK